jgi:hypothetical protein
VDIKHIIEGLSAGLTPLIAAVMTYIAYQQWRTNKNRLTHELYDRRSTVFKAVRDFYGEMGDAGTVKYGIVMKFYATTAEAEFLFGDEVREHIEELYKKGMHLASLHEKMYPSTGEPGLPVGEERSRVAEEHRQLHLWFHQDGITETRKRFRKYLAVSA